MCLTTSRCSTTRECDGEWLNRTGGIQSTQNRPRRRGRTLVNKTHRELLLKFSDSAKGFSSVCGFRAEQTESNHSRVLKVELQRATGNPELTAYCLRHTGKHLGEIKGLSSLPAFVRIFGWHSNAVRDDYGRAGVYSKAMIDNYRGITNKLLEGLEDHESPNPDAASAKVLQLRRR